MNVARTGYLVSLVSYVAFLTLEWLRPGFVTNVFSPHVFLASAIVFGVLWVRQVPSVPPDPSRLLRLLSLFSLSLLLTIFSWSIGRPFGDFRVLVTLVAFVLPWMVWNETKK